MTRRSADALPAHLCGGALHRPGDPGYDDARAPWNLAADLRPAAVAHPGTIAELAEVVRAARDAGLRVAVVGTGHAAGTLPALSDAVLVRTSALCRVTVDARRALVRVQAGVLWADAVEAAAAQGLAVLHGSSPDVGVVGYSLGGGLGWYARALGLQAHGITAATVVTSSGEILRVDEDSHPELIWALRGGGGNFVIVAELEFRAYRLTTAYAGLLAWDLDRAADVLPRWASWASCAPDAVTTSLRFLRLPPIPEVPEQYRGRNLVAIDGAVLADDAKAEQVLAPLRELQPEIDTFGRLSVEQLVRLHMDPEGPTACVAGTTLLTGLPDEALEALLAAAGPAADPQVMAVELRQLGGAVGRVSEVPAALPAVAAPYALLATTVLADPQLPDPLRARCQAVVAAVRPWAAGQLLNFAESPLDVASAFPAEHWQRLRALRFVWDPDEVLVASHRIPPAIPRYDNT
jgi:FAD/FMN-containing dehydrogenase